MNVGVNLGRAAGAGVPGHLHVHVLPRWSGDTNFMTAVAEVRVLPESLRTGYDKLKAGVARVASRAVTDDADDDDEPSGDEPQGDELPEDLDVTAYVGPYVFPDIKRRRIAGTIYVVLGALVAVGRARDRQPRARCSARSCSPSIAAYHFVAGWPLRDRPDRSARGREPHGRLPGRARVGAARVARPALSRPGVAHPRVQRRRAAERPRPRRARRGRRPRARRVHRDTTPKTGRSTPVRVPAATRSGEGNASCEHLLSDFKKFILRGNVLDLAVAVIVGAAFNAVVAVVRERRHHARFIGRDLRQAELQRPGRESSCRRAGTDVQGVVAYGDVHHDVVNFLIIALRGVRRSIKTFERHADAFGDAATMDAEPEPDLTVDQELLAEIRDLAARSHAACSSRRSGLSDRLLARRRRPCRRGARAPGRSASARSMKRPRPPVIERRSIA